MIPEVGEEVINANCGMSKRNTVEYIESAFDLIKEKQPALCSQIFAEAVCIFRDLEQELKDNDVDISLDLYKVQVYGLMSVMVKLLYIQEEINEMEEADVTGG